MPSLGEKFRLPEEKPLSKADITQHTVSDALRLAGMFPVAQQPEASKENEVALAQVEALKILEKDAFKLGDLNPLIHATDLTRRESVDAVRHTTLQKIQENGGLLPQALESTVVYDPGSNPPSGLRFIARFEVPKITEQQLVLLEELVG